MARHNIAPGSRWRRELDDQLKGAEVGIIVVTPENLEAPWLNFEVGALAKSVGDAKVIPYLVGFDRAIEATSLPLELFFALEASESGTRDLLVALNQMLPDETRLDRDILTEQFAHWWPRLAGALAEEPRPSADRTESASERVGGTNPGLGSRATHEPPGDLSTIEVAELQAQVRRLEKKIDELASRVAEENARGATLLEENLELMRRTLIEVQTDNRAKAVVTWASSRLAHRGAARSPEPIS